MDSIEAKQYCLIVEKAKELSILLNGNFGSHHLHEIISYYDFALKDYNNANRCAIDKTPTERASFHISVKKIIRANSYRYKKGVFDDYSVFNDMINSTEFSEELIDSYILFNRKYPWYPPRTELGRILLDTFRITIISIFEECNREFLFT